jgi:phenylalanyl-tRNA synthetase beta chain
MLEAMASDAGRYRGIPGFPAMRRDLALAVGEATSFGSIQQAVMGAGRPELEAAELFDLYRGEQAGKGRKSLALSLRFRLADRALSDQEVSRAHQRIVDALRLGLGAEVR